MGKGNSALQIHTRIGALTQMALLFALTMVLSLLENWIPALPMLPPGVKLGLSNIAVMYCLFFMGKGQAWVLFALKVLFVLITRGPVAFFMSLSGGILSIFMMILLLSLKKINLSYIMTSVLAAIAHNLGQLLASIWMMSSITALYYAPVLLISGCVMGVVTGTVLRVTLPAMKKMGLQGLTSGNFPERNG